MCVWFIHVHNIGQDAGLRKESQRQPAETIQDKPLACFPTSHCTSYIAAAARPVSARMLPELDPQGGISRLSWLRQLDPRLPAAAGWESSAM